MRPILAIVAGSLLITGCARTPVPAASTPKSLAEDLTGQLDALTAKSSAYAKHLPSGKTFEVRADQPMNTLSVIKIPVMIQAFRDAEAGRLKLTDRYQIRPEDLRRGSGLIQTFDVGLAPTYRDLIEQMIITSDNTATDILIKTVGLDRVNAMLTEFGYQATRLQWRTADLFKAVWVTTDSANAKMTDREVFERGFPRGTNSGPNVGFKIEGDSALWLGRTTAKDMARMLEDILNGKLASKEHSEQMVEILKRQFYSSRLPRFLQWRSPVEVAHKTGDWPPFAANDVGILFYEGGPTVVSVFTNQSTGDFLEVESAIGRIAERLVNEWK
ncbi:MAG: serine hydrolase [Gemmatimonadales bacterium]